MLIFAVVAGSATIGLWAYQSVAAENDWRRVEAELDAIEPRWRLAELEADRPPIDDADNAGLQIILAHSKAPKLHISAAKGYDKIFAKLKPTIQLNSQQVDLIRQQLAIAPDAIAEARKLKDMRRGHFAVRSSVDFIATQIPHHIDAGLVSEWLLHDAYLLAQGDRCDEALDNCRAILNIGRTTGDDRFLLSHWIRIGHQTTAAETAERILAQGVPSKDSLLALQLLFAREMTESSWTGSLKGELAGWHYLFEQIRKGNLDRTYLRDLMRWRRSENLVEQIEDHLAPTMMIHAPDCLRIMNRRIEISRLPLHEQRAKLRELEEAASSRNPVYGSLAANGARALGAELRSQGMLRTTLVALACERYRLDHKRWPATLDVLVAEKLLPALPTDPVDGQPLRYHRDAEGVIVYSIGLDEKDDQGNIVRAPLVDQRYATSGRNLDAPGEDIGFRLWNEPRRREPAR